MKMKPMGELSRRAGALVLAAAVLWVVFTTAGSTSLEGALDKMGAESGLALLRQALGDFGPMGPAALAISQSPLLVGAWQPILELRSLEETDDSETEEEIHQPVLETPTDPVQTPPEPTVQVDNGMPAKTLLPSGTSDYLISGLTYVNNASRRELTVEELTGDYAHLGEGEPQVLILHAHGSEAYTMPPGESYESTGDYRTTDTAYNVVRVGDEIAAVLAERGISVIHDRSLYDHPNYNGAYGRSLAAAESYLEKYPSITFVLDIHRDAIADGEGNMYKVVSDTELGRTAQLSLVMGSDGSGDRHDTWKENLRLAVAVQNRLLEDHPTLMRPIILRNSRYNQHCAPGCLLVEVGAAGNSLDEALLAAQLFGEAFAEVIQ